MPATVPNEGSSHCRRHAVAERVEAVARVEANALVSAVCSINAGLGEYKFDWIRVHLDHWRACTMKLRRRARSPDDDDEKLTVLSIPAMLFPALRCYFPRFPSELTVLRLCLQDTEKEQVDALVPTIFATMAEELELDAEAIRCPEITSQAERLAALTARLSASDGIESTVMTADADILGLQSDMSGICVLQQRPKARHVKVFSHSCETSE